MTRFMSWEELRAYIKQTKGIEYFDNPTGWVEALRELVDKPNIKWIKKYDAYYEVHGLYTEAGEFVVTDPEYYEAEGYVDAQNIKTGGANSAPKVKSVVTNTSGGGTAVITDEAVAVKDTGISGISTAVNVVSGLLGIYGLIHTGITIANMQVWKDMANYVYDSDFTEDTPLERVVDFWKNKAADTIIDITSDGELIVNITESTARKMYDFMSNHMIEEQTPGLYPSASILAVLNLAYNYINRTFSVKPGYTLERYMSVTNPNDTCPLTLNEISDDLFKAAISDFATCMIGAGFLVPANVIAALMASMEGIMQYLRDESMDAVDTARFCNVKITLDRGVDAPTKETALALSEFKIELQLYDTKDKINISADDEISINTIVRGTIPDDILNAGSSFQSGDNVKYLKRGKTGTQDTDYGYQVYAPQTNANNKTVTVHELTIRYPSNEQYKHYTNRTISASDFYGITLYVNGITYRSSYSSSTGVYNGPDIYTNVPNRGISYGYSNLGYEGHGTSYQPDDYLVTAGFKSKKDSSGFNEKHPDPTKTMEEQYPELNQKKEVATVAINEDPVTGEKTTTNEIIRYVPTFVPAGSTNADRLIKHGYNNDTDPDTYIDNRSQQDKLIGKINTDDPIDGVNEEVDTAKKEYTESRTTPDSFPYPIPQNQPVQEYPDTPPTKPLGDSGDTPTPATMTGVTASGMCSVYNPTKTELKNFSAWLWSSNFLDNFLKIFQNPMDAIIGLHIMYATPHTTTPSNIIAGYLDSGVSAKVVDQQFTEIDCGSVFIPELYGDARDYEPYVQIHCYLPFVGIVSLKPNDVINKTLNIKYGVDAMTGTCLATLTTKKGSSEIATYNFAGNCATQVPISGGSYAQMITGLAGIAASAIAGAATGNPLALLGAGASILNTHLDVSHSGSIGANAGAMGIRKPYIIITRKIAYDAEEYSTYYGYPANKTIVLGKCKGFIRVKSVHITNIGVATDTEKTEIETLLKQGIIIQ